MSLTSSTQSRPEFGSNDSLKSTDRDSPVAAAGSASVVDFLAVGMVRHEALGPVWMSIASGPKLVGASRPGRRLEEASPYQIGTLSVPIWYSPAMPEAARKPDVGGAIRALRKEKGWSQSELARRAKLTPATVSRIESGARDGDIETLVLIAAGLGLALYLLIKRAEGFGVRFL